jgi:hypothetical protein
MQNYSVDLEYRPRFLQLPIPLLARLPIPLAGTSRLSFFTCVITFTDSQFLQALSLLLSSAFAGQVELG